MLIIQQDQRKVINPMLVGAHMANGPITDADLALFKTGGFSAAKLMDYHTMDDVKRIRAEASICHFMGRLPNFPLPQGVSNLPRKYADACLGTIEELYPAVTLYQFATEPNEDWVTVENGPFNFTTYARESLKLLRDGLKDRKDVRLISPPLSWAPGMWRHDPPGTPPEKRKNKSVWILDQWLNAYLRGAEDGGNFLRLFDLVGADSYFQSAGQMQDLSYGGSFQTLHMLSGGMDVVLCEWASSCHLLSPRPDVEAVRTATYPAYLRWLQGFGYVQDSYVFINGGTATWEGFRLTERVCTAVAGAL